MALDEFKGLSIESLFWPLCLILPKLMIVKHRQLLNYSRSSRKRPPRKLKKVVVTRAGRVREATAMYNNRGSLLTRAAETH